MKADSRSLVLPNTKSAQIQETKTTLRTHQKQPGDIIPPFEVATVTGIRRAVPDSSARFTHLQFRRFAGCPICNTHLRTFVRAKPEIDRAGIREIVLFHSSADLIRHYEDDIALDFVADPQKRLYRQFGVGSSPAALLHRRVLGAIVRSLTHEKWRLPKVENGRLGLPADFLLDRAGRVVAAKYGTHAFDQWSVAELFAIARTNLEPSTAGAAS